MDEMNEMIHEEPVEEVTVEETVPAVEIGTEQPTIELPTEQEPIPGPEIPTPSLSETDTVGSEDSSTEPYNQGQKDDENELGSCDCRSECRYNTGHTYKYADYGYSG